MAFLQSIADARAASADDPAVLSTCCTKLQEHNAKLKAQIAQLDAEAAHEAMVGGVTGIGCDHSKLIAALCSRTKSQLRDTAKAYVELYGKELRETDKKNASGDYGTLLHLALAPPDVYFADIIDLACGGMGCDHDALIELGPVKVARAP